MILAAEINFLQHITPPPPPTGSIVLSYWCDDSILFQKRLTIKLDLV